MSVRMVHRCMLGWVGGLVLWGSASTAAAFSTYPPRIPNGTVNRCLNCHLTAQGGTARNSFGNDTRATRTGALPNWPALYALDSDGDGFTNGEEMGDPCGRWTLGTMPMFTMVTLPGDANSVPTEHTNLDCGASTSSSGGASSSGSGGASDGGQSSGAASTSSGTTSGGSTGGDTGGSSGSSGDGGEMGCTACDASGSAAPALAVFGAMALMVRRRRP